SGKFADQLGIPCCGLANHEERRANAKRREETVHEGREHRIRTVVERQRNGRRGHVEPSNHREVAASERGHAPPEQSPASVLSTGRVRWWNRTKVAGVHDSAPVTAPPVRRVAR